MQQRHLDRAASVQHQHSLFVQGQECLPLRVLHVADLAVGMPMRISPFSIHPVHELMRGGIVLGHRLAIRIVGIEHPRPRGSIWME
jgi:hypothetical protein